MLANRVFICTRVSFDPVLKKVKSYCRDEIYIRENNDDNTSR